MSPETPRARYPLGKRLLDFGLALFLLLLLWPLLLLLALLVASKLGRPVFFRQERPGLGGRPFKLIKFRSMSEARGPDGELLPDADRLPPFGRWLRATSLDELPELLNILKGEMSFVGPRPLLMRYLERYSTRQARRHERPPGLTGWAQVNGRNALDWPSKLELDVWYIEHQSLWLDLRILFKTFLTVLRREGISGEGEATMGEFMGETSEEAKQSE